MIQEYSNQTGDVNLDVNPVHLMDGTAQILKLEVRLKPLAQRFHLME